MRITIYMRSGNQIKLDNISDVKVEKKGNTIVSLKISSEDRQCGDEILFITSIDLTQIEAITGTRT